MSGPVSSSPESHSHAECLALPRTVHSVPINGQNWQLEGIEDLETLWLKMSEDIDSEDCRIPYWVEVWPAGIILGEFIATHREQFCGSQCLDLGCGLGLTACIGSQAGARVWAVDREFEALHFTRLNTGRNNVGQVQTINLDWNYPPFKPGVFDFIWGGDVFYEKIFYPPIRDLLDYALAPGGKAYFGDPDRTISRSVWANFRNLGWHVKSVACKDIPFAGSAMNVCLRELSRPL